MDGRLGRGGRRLHLVGVQHASGFACSGSATASYDNSNVCSNSAKQESQGFLNLDSGHENHDDERNDVDRDTRKAIPTGIWMCGSTPCAANTTVQSAMSSAQLVGVLYQNKTGRAGRTSCDHPSDEHPGSSASSHWSPSAWSVCSV